MTSQSWDSVQWNELFFVDKANNPIPRNQIMITRGDGYIYFTNLFSTNFVTAFNEFRANVDENYDNDIVIQSSNTNNILRIQQGNGVSFVVSTGRIVTNLIGPEQLFVDQSSIQYSNLGTYNGSRTLFFKGVGDMNVYVSTNSIIMDAPYSSSYSSIVYLNSTALSFYLYESQVISSLDSVIILPPTILELEHIIQENGEVGNSLIIGDCGGNII